MFETKEQRMEKYTNNIDRNKAELLAEYFWHYLDYKVYSHDAEEIFINPELWAKIVEPVNNNINCWVVYCCWTGFEIDYRWSRKVHKQNTYARMTHVQFPANVKYL